MICQAKPSASFLARQSAAKTPPVQTAAPIPTAQPEFAYSATAVPAAMPIAPFADGNAFAGFDDQVIPEPSNQVFVASYRKKKKSGLTLIFVAVFLLVCLGGTAAAVIFLAPAIKDQLNARLAATNKGANSGTAATSANNPAKPIPEAPIAAGPEFPRRLLGISINNYIYANPTSYGSDATGGINRDFGQTLAKLADRLRVPPKQVYELSDSSRGPKPIPPLKLIVERTIHTFLQTSRAQDRIILMLCAHTAEIEGKPYLAPLEGDLEDAKSLIPLEWLMRELDECPAQQKLLIADFNRYDRARGLERPNGGKLAASTEAMLRKPPKGVQVWSACSAGQYSYEFDFAEFHRGDDKNKPSDAIKGGVFLSLFSKAFREGQIGIQKPDNPLPMEKFVKRVNEDVTEFASTIVDPDTGVEEQKDDTKDAKKEDKKGQAGAKKPAAPAAKSAQTPFFAGEMKSDQLAFDAAEPAAKPLSIPTPSELFAAGIVRSDEIERLLNEIMLPPLKMRKSTDTDIRFDRVFPFMADAVKEYMDKTTIEQIKKEKDKYPLRFAVISAVEQLRAMDADPSGFALPDTITEADRTDAAKNNLARLQRGPARVMQKLEEIMDMLNKAGEERKGEKSKRWQAHFDYVSARVKSRYVYVHEYTSAVGLIRKDILPELDKQKGLSKWKLASTNRLLSGAEVKDIAKDAKKLYAKLIKENPRTPWEVLAKRERGTALGLQWELYGEANSDIKDSP